MEEYIELIEKFLRGQMSHEEESAFKKSLITDAHMRTCAFIIAFIMKTQKTG
jgi:hypothetical protein